MNQRIRDSFDPAAFLVVGLMTALLRVVLLSFDEWGGVVAYAAAGLACGWVLRTRLPERSRRVLLVGVCAAAFAVCGAWVELLPVEADPDLRMSWAMAAWAVGGAVIGVPYLSWGRLLAMPVLAGVAFALAGTATQLAMSLETPWDPLPGMLLGFMLICAVGGTLCDYFCGRLGLRSSARGVDRLQLRASQP